jgi:tetratricopeptide (TPR) repeat protein
VPLVKSDADTKAKEAYQFANDQKAVARLMQLANKQMTANQPDNAIPFLDSILVIRPNDAVAVQKKKQITDQKEADLKRAQDEAQQNILLQEAIAAKDAGNLDLAETKLKAADALIPNQPKITAERQQITQLRNEAADAQAKTEAFQKAMQAAAAFITAKKYDEAEAKYKEAQKIKPAEKETVNTQLTLLKDLRFEIQN